MRPYISLRITPRYSQRKLRSVAKEHVNSERGLRGCG